MHTIVLPLVLEEGFLDGILCCALCEIVMPSILDFLVYVGKDAGQLP
jgi:hypothetical protein